MTFHTQVVGANGQRQAMFIERMPGLAEVILVELHLRAARRDDRLLGRGDLGGAGRDGPRRAPARPAGHRRDLGRAVDVGRPGSRWSAAACSTRPTSSSTCARRTPTPWSTIDGLDTPVGPGSTITAVAIVNSIKVRTAQLLVERGAMPPVITRASVVGAERSRSLFDEPIEEHARRIARAISRDTDDGEASPAPGGEAELMSDQRPPWAGAIVVLRRGHHGAPIERGGERMIEKGSTRARLLAVFAAVAVFAARAPRPRPARPRAWRPPAWRPPAPARRLTRPPARRAATRSGSRTVAASATASARSRSARPRPRRSRPARSPSSPSSTATRTRPASCRTSAT